MLELNDENFKQEVKRSEKPVIVDFWAPWCGPCLMLAPTFEEVSKDYDTLKFAKLNTQDFPELSQKHNVMSIPCLILFNKGEEVDRIIGALPRDALKRKIDAALERVQA